MFDFQMSGIKTLIKNKDIYYFDKNKISGSYVKWTEKIWWKTTNFTMKYYRI